jgi:hypothetical protein
MPDTIRDIRPMYPGVFDAAEVGQFGLTATGASVSAIRFARQSAAREAQQRFVHMLQSPETKRDGVGAWLFGWPGNRLEACVAQVGRTMMVWVAGNVEEVDAFRATSAAFSRPAPAERRGLAHVIGRGA